MNFKQNAIDWQQIWKYRPLFYFCVFVICNALLSYSGLGWDWKILIGLAGIALPLVLAFVSPNDHSLTGKQVFKENVFKPLGIWVWILLVGLAIFVRFYHLVMLPVWPMWDDSFISFISIKQMQNWSWQLSFSSDNLPPLIFWLQALFFKLAAPSQFTLWFFAAGLSVLIFLSGIWASYVCFSFSLVFLFALILGLSYWPLFLGQFSSVVGLFPLWELILMGVLGCFFQSIGKQKEQLFAFELGLCGGVGLYLWIVAMLPIMILSAFVLWFFTIKRSIKFQSVLLFFLPLILLFIPLAPQTFGNIFHGHVAANLVGQTPMAGQLRISLSYLTAPLWGTTNESYFNFGPLWGGFFNPVLGSLFLLGWIEIYRLRQKTVFWWVAAVFAICLIPGMISNSIEIMRILPIFPFCLLLAALGIQALLRQVSKKIIFPLLVFCFVLSLGLDGYHLLGPYHQWAVPHKNMSGFKSPEHFRAFQVLEKLKSERGMGLVFTDFYYDVFDESLFVTTYDFNPVVNPTLDISECRWAAVLLAPWDREDFLRRFPKANIYDLSSGLGTEGNEMYLALMDVSEPDFKVLRPWIQIHRQISDIYPFYPFHVKNPSDKEVLSRLLYIYGKVSSDPFLKNCLEEKMIDAVSQSSDPHDALRLDGFKVGKARFSRFFDRKCANAFHKLAILYTKAGDENRARKMLLKAASLDPQYPLSRNLGLMEKMIADQTRKKS